jgi:DNA-binding beta-propeller fold protein YncE
MRYDRSTIFLMELLVSGTLLCSRTGLAQNLPDQAPNNGTHLASVQTYLPNRLHRSVLEHMSGAAGVYASAWPSRIIGDSRGRILIADSGLHAVHVFDAKIRKYSQIKGKGPHALEEPIGIAVDANDNIYVSDRDRSSILVFTAAGRFLRTIGDGVLLSPSGIAIDKQNDTLYVADSQNNDVVIFDLNGSLRSSFGNWGSAPGMFYSPQDVVLSGQTLVVLDSGNSRLQVFDLQGKFETVWPFDHLGGTPVALAFDSNRNLYYVDSLFGGLSALDSQGRSLALAGNQWRSKFACPAFSTVWVDTQDDVVTVGSALDLRVFRLSSSAP